VNPLGEFTIDMVRVIVPGKPPSELVDIMDVKVADAKPVTDVGLADIAKSQTVYRTVTAWESVPLFPVTVTV